MPDSAFALCKVLRSALKSACMCHLSLAAAWQSAFVVQSPAIVSSKPPLSIRMTFIRPGLERVSGSNKAIRFLPGDNRAKIGKACASTIPPDFASMVVICASSNCFLLNGTTLTKILMRRMLLTSWRVRSSLAVKFLHAQSGTSELRSYPPPSCNQSSDYTTARD